MKIDFRYIRGPKDSKTGNFHEMVSQILLLEIKKITIIEGKGGDKGVDAFIGKFGGCVSVFQAKYYCETLKPSQRRDIERSLHTALANHDVGAWTLVISKNPTPAEEKWFDNLREQYPQVSLEWWGETKLRTLISKWPNVASQFFRFDLCSMKLLYDLYHKLDKVERTLEMSSYGPLAAIYLQPWTRKIRMSTATNHVVKYFIRTSQILRTVQSDLHLVEKDVSPIFAVDFSEIHTYLVGESKFLLNRAIIQHCFDKSKYTFFLLPGSIFEMVQYLQNMKESVFRSTLDDTQQYLSRHSTLIRKFITCFEKGTFRPETIKAYNALRRSLPIVNISLGGAVKKLMQFKKVGGRWFLQCIIYSLSAPSAGASAVCPKRSRKRISSWSSVKMADLLIPRTHDVMESTGGIEASL